MKNSYVTDTHALIWRIQNNPKLSSRCQQIFSQVDEGGSIMIIPTIVLVEMIYLAEKKRIEPELVTNTLKLLQVESENYQLNPLDLAVVAGVQQIQRALVPDMPDRIIAATALSLGLPLLSRDSAIAKVSELRIIW